MPEIIPFRYSWDAAIVTVGDVIHPSKYIDAYVLEAGVAKSVAVPEGARIASFSSTNNFYVNFQATAAVPSGDIDTGAAPELNPAARDISGYSSFSMISQDGATVIIAYFS